MTFELLSFARKNSMSFRRPSIWESAGNFLVSTSHNAQHDTVAFFVYEHLWDLFHHHKKYALCSMSFRVQNNKLHTPCQMHILCIQISGTIL